MRSTQIACDECGAVKKESNHWWRASLRESGGAIIPGFTIVQAGVSLENGRMFDLCSESCVQKTVSKYMRGEFRA